MSVLGCRGNLDAVLAPFGRRDQSGSGLRDEMVLLEGMRRVTGEPGPHRVAGMALAEPPANSFDGPDTTVLGRVFEQHREPAVVEAGDRVCFSEGGHESLG